MSYTDQEISFDGSGSYDTDTGDTITYYWYFGDGTNSDEESPRHAYTTEGNFTVELTVTDSYNEQSKSTTYAIISTQSVDDPVNGKDDEDGPIVIPGFEIFFVIMALIFVIFIKKRRR